ncbi:pol II transcription elongation factor [Coprinopsis cinerea okayama7|uniref:Pol II transcription elongation factor n=1 Tax=Coprinopsis cinerea (strain Okayama-7 / 130 / ATCC MYA-4618 / FGSC 9003) TaxID=240176 RepID=A8N7C5_COPC7|nr:pol II transcription elongation factor [Coprinopsis cinerea okayama7\|eukprot:XP_001830731.2 pol II transcription elongation factor [Coprinopsis cinerea okayama7\
MDDIASGRSVDIELGGQEVITIELDGLDENTTDVLDLLKEGQCKVWIWTKLAAEYFRRGWLSCAEQIALAAVETLQANGTGSTLAPIYALLANLQLAKGRDAPMLVLEDAQLDRLPEAEKTEKIKFTEEASKYLNKSQQSLAENPEDDSMGIALPYLSRGIQQLAQQSFDEALRSFEGVLSQSPTNIARVLFQKKFYKEALRLYQDVLRYKPNCKPDPRVGIGMCLWALGHKEKAKQAWQRSLEVNPGGWQVQLLLGIESINASKSQAISEEAKTQAFLSGTEMVGRTFRMNSKNASAANAMCEIMIRKGKYQQAMKLAERTIQFADTRTLLAEGYLRAARAAHAQGNLQQARQFYATVLNKLGDTQKDRSQLTIASIGMAQLQMHYDEAAAAIHTLDTLIQQPNTQRSPEAIVMLASLRACPRPGVSSSEVAQEKAQARDLFDRALKGLEIDGARHGPSKASLNITDDLDMHLEIARLWQGENTERVYKAYKEAMRISETFGDVDPRLVNNLGVLEHLEGRLSEARTLYESALTKVAGQGKGDEAMSTSMLFNLARVYEDEGDVTLAKEAYDKLLSRHPEYIDAKIRQSQMLLSVNKFAEANDLLKQCLSAHPSNLNLRAAYLHFLMQTIRIGDYKSFKEFVFSTLKDHDKHDVYSLCAAAWLHFFQARESRDVSQKGLEERRKAFQRAAEYYEKALQLDPQCAYAAQGLAIIIAEDALGNLYGAMGSAAPDDHQRRLINVREALDIFAKVRESINDGSVYTNMGHCYYSRDEFDRAIESYETASGRFYQNQNYSVLMCLCRSWYSKAIKDQSPMAMNTALRYAQSALHILPNDKVALYNIAMIQQKAAEMMFSIPAPKRNLKDLQRRRKYGDIMLRKAEEHLSSQRQYESEQQARLEAARQKRLEEKLRLEEEERLRMEALRIEAEKLAEERRIAREQAMEWTREVKGDSDEEKEKRPKKAKKPRSDHVSGDEGEPKKRRRGKLRKEKASSEQPEEENMFSEEDEPQEKPKKPRAAKKRVVRDDDDEDGAGPRKKQFKSREVLSDTDDEMS